MNIKSSLLSGAVLWLTSSAFAASYVVPSDRAMIARSNAIVVAHAINTYVVDDPARGIETITHFSVEEAIKGGAILGSSFDLHEPGGQLSKRFKIVFGAPQFAIGEPILLFIYRFPDGSLTTTDFGLGQFAFATDDNGHRLLMRSESDITGWDIDGTVHHERRRDATRFLDFVRATAKATGSANPDYYIPTRPLMTRSNSLRTTANFASMGPTSYTLANGIETAEGFRWNVFPAAVNWNQGNTLPSAPGGGTTAITTAFTAWNGDTGSNVNYVLATSNANPNGTGMGDPADMVNNIVFERTNIGTPYNCATGGLLGQGGITQAIPANMTNILAGEDFNTTIEGDVSMNVGLNACGPTGTIFTSGDFNTAVTHEIGHTLGFRHSDLSRDNLSACSTDPNLECSVTAIMKASIVHSINGALQPWDMNAVRAVYPGVGGTLPLVPTGVNAHAISTTQVSVTWTAVALATSYQVSRQAAGGVSVSFTPVATNSFTDTTAVANSAYLYRVKATNLAGSSANSSPDLATTVIFTNDPLVAGTTLIKAIHLAELRTAVNAVRALAGLAATTFTDAATPGVVVKAVHITQLRTGLDAALTVLGLPAGGYANAVAAGVVIKAIDFQEIRNRVK